jgi:hypothetical protein
VAFTPTPNTFADIWLSQGQPPWVSLAAPDLRNVPVQQAKPWLMLNGVQAVGGVDSTIGIERFFLQGEVLHPSALYDLTGNDTYMRIGGSEHHYVVVKAFQSHWADGAVDYQYVWAFLCGDPFI